MYSAAAAATTNSSTHKMNNENEEVNNNNENEFETKRPLDQKDMYTFPYRIVKTCLLVFAWISFGINNEIVGSTFEDLRILIRSENPSLSESNQTMNATVINDYQRLSLGLELRGFGCLVTLLLAGGIYDKLINYADLIMGISSFIFVLRKLTIF